MKRLFGTQGFRGLANITLTSTVAQNVGLALAAFLNGKGSVAIGWDTRTSSEMLSHAVSSGLMAGGCDVQLLGLVPTPLLSFTIPKLQCKAGVMVTASHNPPEFNGIKLWDADGASFTSDTEQQIEAIYFQADKPYVPWDQCGHQHSMDDVRSPYVNQLLKEVNQPEIKKRDFTVIADCGGGAASVIIPTLLQRIGVKAEVIHCEPDGFFQGRLPEPKEQNLQKLIELVKEKNADVGMAWDGDADRIVLITNRGRYLMGDRTFALAASHYLHGSEEPTMKIVTQVATSDVIRDVADAVGAQVVETRVGEPNIVAKMKEVKAQIGGEENGGVIYYGWSWTREGMLTALLILDLLAKDERTLEQLDQQFPSYAQVKDSIQCPEEHKSLLMKRVKEIAPSNVECQTLDGVKLRYSDGWLLLRPSGTEPIFRVFAEAKTTTRAKSLMKTGLKLAQDAYADIT